MSAGSEESVIKKFEDFTYFDNLALWYLCNETPPHTLALAFLGANEKVCGSMLGVMEVNRRKYIHQLMVNEKEASLDVKLQAAEGIFIIADGLISRNLIIRKGKYYYGQKKS